MPETAAAADRLAFGFRIEGVESGSLNRALRPSWPRLVVRREVGPIGERAPVIGDRSVCLGLGEERGWLLLERDTGTATYASPEGIDEDRLVHPLLAPAAGLIARWHGRELFHAGAFVAAGGAWALAGTNEAGKSSLLAALALAGTPVLTDDLLVVDADGQAYAGPRCVDLRELGIVGEDVGDRVRSVRAGTRLRLDLPAVDASAALRGWIFLEWGEEIELVPCPLPERFDRLTAQRRWPIAGADPRIMLDVAALPAWTLRRPRGARHMGAVLARLLAAAGQAPDAASETTRLRRAPRAA